MKKCKPTKKLSNKNKKWVNHIIKPGIIRLSNYGRERNDENSSFFVLGKSK